jgi:DNA-binding XRE family transcriptional regulator
MSLDLHALGARIRTARTHAGLSQDDLALATGLHRATVGRIEVGRHGPSLQVAYALALALGLTLDELTGANLLQGSGVNGCNE